MFFLEMTEEQTKRYDEDLRHLHHVRGSYMLLMTIGLFLCFGILDYILVPSLFPEFIQYRLIGSGFCLFLFLLNYRDTDLQYTVVISFSAYVLFLLVIALMVVRMGGVTSPYFAGFIIAIVIYNAMLPVTTMQSLLSGFVAVAMYLAIIFFWCPLANGQESILVNNVFFMAGFVLLVSLQSRYETRDRQESFFLQLQEEKVVAQLNEQAEALEMEVVRRTREQQRREHCFQLLFEHIADDVILVDEKGGLLYANPPFFNHLGFAEGEDVNLADLVPRVEKGRLDSDLLKPVARGEVVAGFSTRFFTADGECLEVEINGNILERQGEVLGLQLIVRDISVRKQMELDLLQSLQVRKQTENATILALARLSEYRDIAPNNHLERIREYTRLLGERLAGQSEYQHHLEANMLSDLFMASVLHDIGMVGIPDAILCKSEKLSSEEQELIRQHTVLGGDVIKAMETSGESSGFLKYAKSIAYFHHEKWDGSGYPFGFKGQEIPLPARIVSLADAYEKMTCERDSTKCEQVSHEQAVDAIVKRSGLDFDPVVVEAFLFQEKEFSHVREMLAVT